MLRRSIAVMLASSSVGLLACEAYHHQPALLPASSPELYAASPHSSAAPEPSASAAIPVRAADPNEIGLARPIQFETGGATLSIDSTATLKPVADFLNASPELTLIRVESHMDDAGGASAALSISQRRAMNVAKKLISLGVDCQRLVPVGFGALRAERGVAIMKAAVRGKPVGGPVAGGGVVAGDPCR
jgi:OOP family OmpA-OmpF porin